MFKGNKDVTLCDEGFVVCIFKYKKSYENTSSQPLPQSWFPKKGSIRRHFLDMIAGKAKVNIFLRKSSACVCVNACL